MRFIVLGIILVVSIIAGLLLAQEEKKSKRSYALTDARESADWVKNAVIYEVYLRSFSKEGTLKALEARIPELKKLGVTVVWLMPIHPTGKENRKGPLGSPYSVQDYYAINPEFGTLDDFKALVHTVHQVGLKIIIDLVANHTAWDNPMLKKHPDWYTHDTSGKIISPNPDWTDVADLNYDRPELRNYMVTMMKYWVRDIGIDGFRCDVAELVPVDFWESARKELDAIKPVMMLSEGTLPEHHVHAFDLTYSWNIYDVLGHVLGGTLPATVFHDLLKTEANEFPRNSLRMRFNTNHDKNAWDAPAVEKFTPQGAKATAVLIFTIPGVPMIYNGEEAGNAKRLGLFEKVDIDWTMGSDYRTLYETLTRIRREHPAMSMGRYEFIQNTDSSKVLSFLRTQNKDKILTVINFSPSTVRASFHVRKTGITRWTDLITNHNLKAKNGSIEMVLSSRGYAVVTPVSEFK